VVVDRLRVVDGFSGGVRGMALADGAGRNAGHPAVRPRNQITAGERSALARAPFALVGVIVCSFKLIIRSHDAYHDRQPGYAVVLGRSAGFVLANVRICLRSEDDYSFGVDGPRTTLSARIDGDGIDVARGLLCWAGC
jgi:hypothetical protein